MIGLKEDRILHLKHLYENKYLTLRKWKDKEISGFDEWVVHTLFISDKNDYKYGHYFRSYNEALRHFNATV